MMVHTLFDINSVSLDDFIFVPPNQQQHQQIGSGELHYFRGVSPYQRGFGRRQRGGGVGDVLRSLWRVLLPVIKSTGSMMGREVLATGGRLLEKMEQGDVSKPSVITEIKKGVDNVLEKRGIGRQFGTGLKRIKGLQSNSDEGVTTTTTRKKSSIIGRTVPKKKVKGKRKRSDVFGGLF